MKRKLLALSLVFVFLFVSGCKKATDVGSSASRNSQSLSYKQFEKLVSDVEKN